MYVIKSHSTLKMTFTQAVRTTITNNLNNSPFQDYPDPDNHVRPTSDTTVEPRLSGPRLSGLFDYPDFFLWSQFFHEY